MVQLGCRFGFTSPVVLTLFFSAKSAQAQSTERPVLTPAPEPLAAQRLDSGDIRTERVPETTSKRLRFLLGTEAVLHSVDMATTVYALRFDGSAREANPLLQPFSQRPAALVAISSGVNALQLYTISKLHKRRPKLAVAWALILIGTETFVVTHNIRVGAQLRAARAGQR